MSDPNFVTFVLFVVTNCLTTKDAKHTKEETQRSLTLLLAFAERPKPAKSWFPSVYSGRWMN